MVELACSRLMENLEVLEPLIVTNFFRERFSLKLTTQMEVVGR